MKLFCIIFILNIIFADYGGGYAGSGFRYGSNAREFSLAGALVADKTPGFYAFSNPALLQYAKSNQIGLSLQSMSLDRSIQTFSFVKNIPPSAGVGIALLRYGTDNIIGRDYMNRETDQFSIYETEGIMSFGVAIGRKIAGGINIKIFFPNIASEIMDKYGGHQKGNSISWDFGFIYKFNRKLIFGGKFEDLNKIYSWEILEPCASDNEQRMFQEKPPKISKIGLAYSGYKNISIYFQEDIVNIPDKYINYRTRLGIEYRLSNNVKLRLGCKQARGTRTSDDKIDGFNLKSSFGIGAPIKVWQRQYIQLDYALDLGSVGEGLSHLFSFSLKF